jgi:hypothetical protein
MLLSQARRAKALAGFRIAPPRTINKDTRPERRVSRVPFILILSKARVAQHRAPGSFAAVVEPPSAVHF